MVTQVASLDRATFAEAMNRVRESRSAGSRYIPRRGDSIAGSSSPMKLVNPPVGLMFFEGAPRICRAGLHVVPCRPNGDPRVALEAYPGFLVRQITSASYKKDGVEGRLERRVTARRRIVDALEQPSSLTAGIRLEWSPELRSMCIDDGSGDHLDAVVCALQAAMALRAFLAGDSGYGIPAEADPLEGWIATVPAP